MASYAKLRNDLVVSPMELDGATVFNIKDPVTGRFFRLREPEYFLVRQLDGETTNEDVARRFRDEFEMNISAENVQEFVGVLEQLFFLENTRAEMETSRASLQGGRERSVFERLLYIQIKAFTPGRFLEWLTRQYRPFHNIYGFIVSLVVIVLGLGLLIANGEYFIVNLYDIFSFGSIVGIVLSLFILVTFHEYSHAVVCRYHGGEVRSMGFLLMYFQPCFYTDLSDAWLFKEKRHRLAVTAAGPFFQLILLAISVMVWRVTVVGSFVNEVARILTIVSWFTYLFNMNPLIKLDAYYLLSDWLDIPNLRQRSFDYMKNVFQRLVLGWPVERIEVTRRERRVFVIYALLALLYTAFLITYVIYLVGTFLADRIGALAWVLLIAALLVTLGETIKSVGRGIVHHIAHMKNLIKQPLRLLTHLVVIAGVVVLVFAVPLPHRVSGEVAVRPIQTFTIEVNEFGFLEKRWKRGGANPEGNSSFVQLATSEMSALDLIPLVADGQEVREGDTLAVVASNQVSSEIVAAQSDLDRLEGQLALLKAPPKEEAVAEARAEVSAAEARYDQLVRERNRVKTLTERNLSSTRELDTIQAAVEVARAELLNKQASMRLLKAPPKPEEIQILMADIKRQEARLQFLREQAEAQSITSPIDGSVSTQQNGGRILSIFDNDKIELLIPVSDFNINLIKLGQTVKLKVRSYPDRVFEGTVVHIPKEADAVDGNVRYLVGIEVNNDAGLLYEGMSGYAKIEIGDISLSNLALRKLGSVVRVEFWSWW